MEYYKSPRWTAEILDCSMPVTLDTYSNCAFNCLYCFSQYQRGIGDCKEDYYKKANIKYVNIEKIKKMFTGGDSQFKEYIKTGKYIQFGGLSDQFDWYEKKHGITLELMKFFDEIKQPISFSTKGAWIKDDKRYMDLFEKNKDIWHVKISIITKDEQKAKTIEGGVPTPKERFELMKKLSELGIKTTLRLRPFIIGLSEFELIDIAKENGAYSVSTEFFCVESRGTEKIKENYNKISELVGYDILEYYKKHSKGCGYLRLSRNIKIKYLEEIKRRCDKYGLLLGVSDAHCKDFGNLKSCCGLPDGANIFEGQLTALITQKNEFCFNDLYPDIELFKPIQWGSATGYNCGNSKKRAVYKGFSFYDFIKTKWNNSKDPNSPYSYTDGAVIPKELRNGNIVYERVLKK